MTMTTQSEHRIDGPPPSDPIGSDAAELGHDVPDAWLARSSELVNRWRTQGIYPYSGDPSDPVAEVARKVFDVCAVSIHERLPSFKRSDLKSRKLTFRLLRHTLETNPDTLGTILRDVLDLTPEQQRDITEVLSKTKLASIIQASKVVTDRLTFIGGLEQLVFGPFKKSLLERCQLHRILIDEMWVFGDQYLLGTDDQSLKAVLKKHLECLGRTEFVDEVAGIDGASAIPDVMLYRQYADRQPGHYEHLVVEIKRPNVQLGSQEIAQIKRYAFSVAANERFDKELTKWKFVIISTDLDDYANQECRQGDREFGHIYTGGPNLNIFVCPWSRLIQECKWRYQFYKDALQLEITEQDSLQYLKNRHGRHLPAAVATGEDPAKNPGQ